MTEYALITGSEVVNVILWDGETPYDTPTGTEAVMVPSGEAVQIGYTYASGTFTAPATTTPTLTAAQAAAASYAELISGGVTVTSTRTPALNGVYPIDANSQMDISTEASFIATFNEFTTGGTTNLPWQLLNGTFVEFPTTTEFLAFAKAVGQLVAAAKLAAAQSGAMPTASITIP
jgi:hypothetical protein